ncbi:MAG: GNAT family N-acetyltransferase [Defluviitaleaceae bacterium]|nr:GNAT family N-acetyltransferase [Defluviitaleaceae bacterium]
MQTMPHYDIVSLTQDNYTIAREVYFTNPEYFAFFGGVSDDESILNAMYAVPDGFDISGKLFVAICDKNQDGKVVAVIDLLADYPNKGNLWLGLLLVHGDLHGKGIGAFVVDGVVKAASSANFDSIRLGIIEKNSNAIRFWEKVSFTHEGKSNDILVFQRGLHESL